MFTSLLVLSCCTKIDNHEPLWVTGFLNLGLGSWERWNFIKILNWHCAECLAEFYLHHISYIACLCVSGYISVAYCSKHGIESCAWSSFLSCSNWKDNLDLVKAERCGVLLKDGTEENEYRPEPSRFQSFSWGSLDDACPVYSLSLEVHPPLHAPDLPDNRHVARTITHPPKTRNRHAVPMMVGSGWWRSGYAELERLVEREKVKVEGLKVELRVLFVESMSSGSEEKSRIYQLVRSGLWICAKVLVQIDRMW